MINWWLDKGIAGYRIDAITHLKKDLDWTSLPPDDDDGLVAVTKKGQNRPGLNKFLDELKAATFDKYNAVTVGEAYVFGLVIYHNSLVLMAISQWFLISVTLILILLMLMNGIVVRLTGRLKS